MEQPAALQHCALGTEGSRDTDTGWVGTHQPAPSGTVHRDSAFQALQWFMAMALMSNKLVLECCSCFLPLPG